MGRIMILVGILVLTVLLAVCIRTAGPLDTQASVTGFISYIHSFGVLAPVIAFVLAVIHGVFPFCPYIILTGAIAAVFGVWWGFALTWSGALLGSALSFVLARYFGQDWFQRLVKRHYGTQWAFLNGSGAFWTILMGRIIPVVPAPVINLGAGISSVSFPVFFVATGLGKLPLTVAYTFLGYAVLRSRYTWEIVIGLTVVCLLGGLYKYFWRRKPAGQ